MNIGDAKRVFDRTRNYITSFNFVMLGFLTIDKTGWNDWYLLIVPAIVLIAIVDSKYIHSKELKSYIQKNPVIMEMSKDIKAIKEKL